MLTKDIALIKNHLCFEIASLNLNLLWITSVQMNQVNRVSNSLQLTFLESKRKWFVYAHTIQTWPYLCMCTNRDYTDASQIFNLWGTMALPNSCNVLISSFSTCYNGFQDSLNRTWEYNNIMVLNFSFGWHVSMELNTSRYTWWNWDYIYTKHITVTW